MRILFLTARLPYPPNRGDRRRTFNFIKTLSRSHSVHLLSFIQGDEEKNSVSLASEYCEKVVTVNLSKVKSYSNLLVNFFSPDPFQVAYYSHPDMILKLNELINTHAYDLIHTQLIRMAAYTRHLKSVPTVLDLTDSMALYFRRFQEHETNIIKKQLAYMEFKRILKYEKVTQEFDRCLVCSDIDKSEVIKTVPDAKIDTVYNSVDTDYYNDQQNNLCEAKTILFNGTLGYPPNADAIQYFLTEIFPIVKNRDDQVKLFIVGPNPSAKLKSCHNNRDVFVTGLVPDLRDYYQRAVLSISPIRFGAGMPTKVLESMAMGVPVISTKLGCAAINDLKPEENILLADRPTEFAQAIIKLINEPELRSKIASAARKLVVKHYSLDAVNQQLERSYLDVIDKKNRTLFDR